MQKIAARLRGNEQFKSKEKSFVSMSLIFENLPKKKYDVVVLDPPWEYQNGLLPYDSISEFELASLPVHSLVKDRGVVFIWVTCPKLDIAIRLLPKWGLAFRGVPFVWVKTRKKDNGIIKGHGLRPSITKPTTEFVIAGSRQPKGRPMPVATENIPQVVDCPRREHSRKPDEVYHLIEDLYPNASRLDMFSREPRIGWDTWGNQTKMFV